MKLIPKLMIVFFAVTGMLLVSRNVVKAKCCVNNCQDGSCCEQAHCPNPKPAPPSCPCGTKPSGACKSCGGEEPAPPPPPPCNPSCGAPLCGQTNGCGGTCANTDAGSWGAWGACSGTEETQTRTNACGTVETNNCPRIAGTVYYDANNNCGGSGWSSGGVAVSLDGGAGSAVSGTGTFTLLASSASSHTLAISLPPGYICSTAAGCNSCSRSGIISPSNNNFFYLTNLLEAWWQAAGAGVYAGSMAGGVTVRSDLPTAGTSLILPGTTGSVAALLRASGSIGVGSGSVSDEGYSTVARYRGKKMDYNFFAAQMGVIRGVDKL